MYHYQERGHRQRKSVRADDNGFCLDMLILRGFLADIGRITSLEFWAGDMCLGGINLKIVSQAVGVDEITQQSEIGNEKRRAKCRTLENKCQVNLKEEGGPGSAMWQGLLETWSGNQYLCVVPDPLKGALTHGRAVPWSELRVCERNLELTPNLPVLCISLSSHLYSSPSSLHPD